MDKLNIKQSFPVPTYDEWHKAAEQLLKGADFQKRLVKKTYEGIDIQPMYFKSDLEGIGFINAIPGEEPYVRSAETLANVVWGWHVTQELRAATPSEFNQIAKADVARGQNGITIILDEAGKEGLDPERAKPETVGKGGLSVATKADFQKALDGICSFDYIYQLATGENPIPATALFVASFKGSEEISGGIAFDPIAIALEKGGLKGSIGEAFDNLAELTRWAVPHAHDLKTVNVQGYPYREAGGDCVQELAFTMAVAAEYVRALMDRKISISNICDKIFFSFAIGGDLFMEVAKLRAARMLWEKIAESFGATAHSAKMFMHCRTATWNKTAVDPWVNMLRVTTEAFAAVCGGCDSLHVSPFDECFRTPDEFSRRIARNVQIILRDECKLNKVIDPAGGSFYVEKLTDEVARKAWALFQEIEKQGGIVKALEAGIPQQMIKATASSREKNINTRKDSIIGVNKYPNMQEVALDLNTPDYAAITKARIAEVNAAKNANFEIATLSPKTPKYMGLAIDAAKEGATLGQISRALTPQGPAFTIEALPAFRGSQKLEAMRKATEKFAAKTGHAPKIFLANMGPIPQHKARADFSYGFFTVGAFDVVTNDGFATVDEAAQAAKASGARVTVICSTDATYPEIVPELTKKLKADTPDMMVIVAGNPVEHTEAFKAAGVDDFIHVTANVFDITETIQKKLGVI